MTSKKYQPLPPNGRRRNQFQPGEMVRIKPDGIPMTVIEEQGDGVVHVQVEDRGKTRQAWFEHYRLEVVRE